MSSQALPGRDAARPAMRVAFALAWLVGALVVAALVVGVAGAASPAEEIAAHGEPARATGSAAPPVLVSAP